MDAYCSLVPRPRPAFGARAWERGYAYCTSVKNIWRCRDSRTAEKIRNKVGVMNVYTYRLYRVYGIMKEMDKHAFQRAPQNSVKQRIQTSANMQEVHYICAIIAAMKTQFTITMYFPPFKVGNTASAKSRNFAHE